MWCHFDGNQWLCNIRCVMLKYYDLGLLQVGLKSFVISVDYRDYMGSSLETWLLVDRFYAWTLIIWLVLWQIRQRDKSKIPLLTSTYKYFLPQHSFFTLPYSIPKFIFPAVALTKNSRTPAAKASPKIFNSSTPSSSSGRNGYQLHRVWGQSIPILLCLYCNPFTFL